MPPSVQASTGKTYTKTAKTVNMTAAMIEEVYFMGPCQDALVFSKAFKKRFDLSPRNYRLSRQELELRDERPQFP